VVRFTCVYAAWCGQLPRGSTSAKIGSVAPGVPPPRPRVPPVACPSGPAATSVSIDGARKSMVDGFFAGSQPQYAFSEQRGGLQGKGAGGAVPRAEGFVLSLHTRLR